MNIIKDETGVYAELPKDSIKFDSKEAEIIYDLTLENDGLQQELQRKDNIINDLKSSIADYQEAVGDYQDELKRKDNNWNELKEELSDDNKFQLFYADENINTIMTLGAKYYREHILDKIKELENEKK